MSSRIVHAACPHDCPDTCAIRVTVQDGRVIRIQGDPDHPPTHGALCTKVSRYAERSYHPERVLHPLKRVGRKGAGQFVRVTLGRGARRHRGTAEGHRAARPASDRAVQLRRHDGAGAGREHGGALLPQARRVAARSHDLLERRQRSAGRHLRRAHRHACRALRRKPADRHLGQQLDHVEPAFLDLGAGREACRREARLHRPAPHRDGRQVPSAHRVDAGHRRRARARRDARADHRTTGSITTTSNSTPKAGRACASVRCNGRPSARRQCAASASTKCAGSRATTAPRRPPRSA